MADRTKPALHERWANLRFSVVGQLLAAPPERGALRPEFERLAAREWVHPVTGEPTRFGVSTIERWYYKARNAQIDPVGVLRKKIRKDSGRHGIGDKLKAAILAQYAAHRSWSYQLHYDNLAALAKSCADLGRLPSYSTVRRFMRSAGLVKRRRLSNKDTEGARRAEARLDEREVRSYENPYVNGLWHLDFHYGSKKVLTTNGEFVTPVLLGIIDDHSRVACHLQWYFAENAENLVHGLAQGIQKRQLPRALLTDNGSAMTADETRQGLARLGIVHELTLPYSPYQNAKQEVFWAQVEGRLLAMLEGCKELTLAKLNQATQAWVELEYNRKVHSEIGTAPLTRYVEGKDVGRPSPSSEQLRLAFTAECRRVQRRSDGTVSIAGRRFEIPSRYRHIEQVTVRFADWDLGLVHLVDARTSTVLCRLFPLDKERNADGMRRTLEDGPPSLPTPPAEPGIAPLLERLIDEHEKTGLPPAYLPKDEKEKA